MRVHTRLIGALALTLAMIPVGMSAQSVAPADAKAFLGKWAVTLEGPNGNVDMTLTLKDDAGKVIGDLESTMFAAGKITDITMPKTDLVLKFTLEVQGMSIPATLFVTPGEGKAKVLLDLGGMMSLPGEGKKAP